VRAELIRIRLDAAGAVPLWPREWLQGGGANPRPAPGAPRRAYVLPVSVGGDGAASESTSCQIGSLAKSTATREELTPTANSPAHVARWMAVQIDAGSIVVEPLTSTDPGWIDCWFFYHPEEPDCA
jgi:hypothetical protein